MTDQLVITNSNVKVSSREGFSLEGSESDLVDMIREELLPPLNGFAHPDGLKFIQTQAPHVVMVHQLPPHVRCVRWITEDSPAEYGPGTKYRKVRISIPYVITFAIFRVWNNQLQLLDRNELYFRNKPLASLEDGLCYPALLNISHMKHRDRLRAWICTQWLKRPSTKAWPLHLEALVSHTWNGAFNRSSERHEGASWYGVSKGTHPDLHPIERWEEATNKNEAFALSVPWTPAAFNTGELIQRLLDEQTLKPKPLSPLYTPPRTKSLVNRFMAYVMKKNAVSRNKGKQYFAP